MDGHGQIKITKPLYTNVLCGLNARRTDHVSYILDAHLYEESSQKKLAVYQ